MSVTGVILKKIVLNWRFYVGFPFLLIALALVISLEIIYKPSRFIYKNAKKLSEWINYSSELKALQKWVFK